MMNLTNKTDTPFTPSSTYFKTSIDPLPAEIRNGMAAMGTIGLLSTFSTFSLLIFITYRMITWRRYYDHPIGKNQVFVLIYNLLLADIQQGIAFLLSFYWLSQDKLVGPSPACFAQGFFIQVGDMSSGLWVLSIAAHTFINIVLRKIISMRVFVAAVVALWVFVFIMAAVGPLETKKDFYVPTAAWCWISEDHQYERLYLHYIWIFLAQLGSIITYFFIVIFLYGQLSGPAMNSSYPQNSSVNNAVTSEAAKHKSHDPFAASKAKIIHIARYMVIYPVAYVALTLPLAAVRVSAMMGKKPTPIYYLVSGSMMASCGWVDVLLYISTRNVLVSTKKDAVHGGAAGNVGRLVRNLTGKKRNVEVIHEG